MAKLNVNRNVQDPFYRYKMPRILAKVEGKGNGIKTVIANMPDIAKALSRPPTYPTKYFGCELGAQTNFDLKNERYIVNGDHDASKLQDILDGFIKKFVLCPACENPETTLTVKRQSIHGKCKACGNSFLIDPKQKLSTFILKNPPPSETSEAENKEKRGDSGSPAEDNGDDVTVPETNGNGNGHHLANVINIGDDDDDWAPEPTEEEQEKLSAQIGKLVLDKDLDKSVEQRLDMLHQYFQQAMKDESIQDSKKMVNEAERLELKTKAPLLLVDVLFDVDVVSQIKKYRTLLLRFCLSDKKAQRHLLGGVEQLIQTNKAVLLPKTAHIIKALYDGDICDEETILTWGAKPSGKYVKKEFSKEMIKIAQPVLTWLQEAEEDSDTDGEEDGIGVKFDERSRDAGKVVETKPGAAVNGKLNVAPTAAIVKDENGEEIDIDDI